MAWGLLAMVRQPVAYVAGGEFQRAAHAYGAGTSARDSPVVDRGDGNAEVFGELFDVHERLQAASGRDVGGHTPQVRRGVREDRGGP